MPQEINLLNVGCREHAQVGFGAIPAALLLCGYQSCFLPRENKNQCAKRRKRKVEHEQAGQVVSGGGMLKFHLMANNK